MSALLWRGFAALREAFHGAAERGDTVAVVALSNVYPWPEEP